MRIRIAKILSQVYVLPYIKITYDRWLNGDLELIIGWLKWEVVIGL